MKKIRMIIYDDFSVENVEAPEPVPQPQPAPPAIKPMVLTARTWPAAIQQVMADGMGYQPKNIEALLPPEWLNNRGEHYVSNCLWRWSKDNRYGIMKEDSLYYYIREGGK